MKKHSAIVEKDVLKKLTLAMFAEHLYEGLTAAHPSGGRYGLLEAVGHWRYAKNDMLEYANIEFSVGNISLSLLCQYMANHNNLVRQLEDYFLANGINIHTVTYEQLEDMEYTEEMIVAPGRTVERIIRALYDKPYTDEFDAKGVINALVVLEDLHFKFYGTRKVSA